MNRLSTEQRGQIISLFVEGMSMRAISRSTGVARNTIDKLLSDLGSESAAYMDVQLSHYPIGNMAQSVCAPCRVLLQRKVCP